MTDNPTFPRNAQYVALCILNLMPKGWSHPRVSREACQTARRDEPLRDSAAPDAALKVLREHVLPQAIPGIVVAWAAFTWPKGKKVVPWTAKPWAGDFWQWTVDMEATRWDERVADYSGQFGPGRDAWWAYAELWALDLGIRWALMEMVPPPASPLRTFPTDLNDQIAAISGAEPASASATTKRQKLRQPSDSTFQKLTKGVRRPAWKQLKELERRLAPEDPSRMTRASMLSQALKGDDAVVRRINDLQSRFDRAYFATRRWGLEAPSLLQFSTPQTFGNALFDAAVEGVDTLAGGMVARHLATKDELHDLRDDLTSLSGWRWSQRILAKLNVPNEPAWPKVMREAADLLGEAATVLLHIARALPENERRDALTLQRRPQYPEVEALWRKALELCKQTIQGYEDDPGKSPHQFVPYAMAYALMYGLGLVPSERWRTEAMRLGGERADPRLSPVGNGASITYCNWLHATLRT